MAQITPSTLTLASLQEVTHTHMRIGEYSIRQSLYGASLENGNFDDSLEHLCPLDNERHHVIPTSDLGTLKKLPLEFLDLISIETTLRTLTDFRRVNKRAMQVVDSVRVYQSILKQSPGSICAMLSTGLHSVYHAERFTQQ